jgi:hypothetical protein
MAGARCGSIQSSAGCLYRQGDETVRQILIVGAVLALVAFGLALGGGALPVVLTGAFGLVTLLWQQSLQRQGELEKQLASEKRDHSKAYVSMLGEVAAASKGGHRIPSDMAKRLQAWTWTAMLLTSDEALRAQARFVRLGGVEAPEAARSLILPAMADVILALRRDIVPGTKLTQAQILGSFVNEPISDDVFTAWSAQKGKMGL